MAKRKRSRINPYYLIKGEKREGWPDLEVKKYRGDTRAVRELEFPDIETAHQAAKLAKLDTYAIADTKDDQGREPVFKTRDIMEWEASQQIGAQETKQKELAKVERIGKTPRVIVMAKYGRVLVYAQRSVPDYRPLQFRGVKTYPGLFIKIPGKKPRRLDIGDYVSRGRVQKANFKNNFAYYFGGSEPSKSRYDRRSGRRWGEDKLGVYPAPLPQIADDLPTIAADFDKIKRETWSNPTRALSTHRRKSGRRVNIMSTLVAIIAVVAVINYLRNR